jgi:hypothetical protein
LQALIDGIEGMTAEDAGRRRSHGGGSAGDGQHDVPPGRLAKMGPAGDPQAVVDQYCRVHGEKLRIVDASVMPNVPRANTNLTCIMIGERVADWMRAEA